MPRKTTAERVEAARVHAKEALERSVEPHEYPDLVKLALIDYGLRYPEGGARGGSWSRSGRPPFPWLFYDGDPNTRRISRRRKPERVDAFCLFCRVLLVSNATLDFDYSHQLRKHTTPCALRSLAGLMTPGAPYTYRLPSEA